MRNFVKGLLLSTVIFGASAVMADFAIEEGQIYTSGAFMDSNGELWDIVDMKDIGGKTVFTVWNSQTGNGSVTRVVSTARTMPETVRASVYKSTRGLADYYTKNVGPITTGTTVASTSPATTTTATTPKTTTSTMPRNSYPGIGDGTPQGRATYSGQDLYEIQRQSITGPQGTTTTSSASSSANAQTLGDSVASRVALAEGRTNASTNSAAAAPSIPSRIASAAPDKGANFDPWKPSDPYGSEYYPNAGAALAAKKTDVYGSAASPTTAGSSVSPATSSTSRSTTSNSSSARQVVMINGVPTVAVTEDDLKSGSLVTRTNTTASTTPKNSYPGIGDGSPQGRANYSAQDLYEIQRQSITGPQGTTTTTSSAASSASSVATPSINTASIQAQLDHDLDDAAKSARQIDIVTSPSIKTPASAFDAAAAGATNEVPTITIKRKGADEPIAVISTNTNVPDMAPTKVVSAYAVNENGTYMTSVGGAGAYESPNSLAERSIKDLYPGATIKFDESKTPGVVTGTVTVDGATKKFKTTLDHYTKFDESGSATRVTDPTAPRDVAQVHTWIEDNGFPTQSIKDPSIGDSIVGTTEMVGGLAVGTAGTLVGVATAPVSNVAGVGLAAGSAVAGGAMAADGIERAFSPQVVENFVDAQGKEISMPTFVSTASTTGTSPSSDLSPRTTPVTPSSPEVSPEAWGDSLNERAKMAADGRGPVEIPLEQDAWGDSLNKRAEMAADGRGPVEIPLEQDAWGDSLNERAKMAADGTGPAPKVDPRLATDDLVPYATVSNDNVGVLGGKDLFGGGWFSNNSPRIDKDGNLVISDSAANILKNQYGLISGDAAGLKNTLMSDGSTLGDTRGAALLNLMHTQQNLATARSNYNTALNNYNKTNSDIENIMSKAPNGDFTKLSDSDRSKLKDLQSKQESQGKALDAARNARDAAHDANFNAALANLNSAQTKGSTDVNSIPDSMLSPRDKTILDGLIKDGDVQGVTDFLKEKGITGDLADACIGDAADVNNAQGIVKKAEEPEGNDTEVQANVEEVHEINPVELVFQYLAYKKANDKLSVEKDLNIKAGEIGEPMQPVDSSALPTDDGSDGTRATTVLGAASMVKQLLSAATVDLNLLSEKVTFDTPETPTTLNLPGSSVLGGGSAVGGGAPTPEPGPDDDDEDDGEDDNGEDAQKEAVRKEIERRRAELLKQYVSAGIQIAEGMNAISSDFPSRAGLLHSTLEPTNQGGNNNQTSGGKSLGSAVRTEPQAFGLMQDVGRYVLFETLRGVALSSVQMGVQASRLLFEQEVMDETSN